MTIETTIADFRATIEDEISKYGDNGLAPPIHLLEIRSFLISSSGGGGGAGGGTAE